MHKPWSSIVRMLTRRGGEGWGGIGRGGEGRGGEGIGGGWGKEGGGPVCYRDTPGPSRTLEQLHL